MRFERHHKLRVLHRYGKIPDNIRARIENAEVLRHIADTPRAATQIRYRCMNA